MRSLFWKIFMPVLLAMVTLILVSILLVASSALKRSQDLQQTVPQLYEQAKTVLIDQGEESLRDWLKDNTDSLHGLKIFITRRGEQLDLLQRPLPPRSEFIQALSEVRRGERPRRRIRADSRPPPHYDLDRKGRFPNLEDLDGNVYRMSIAKEPRSIRNLIRNERMFWPILISMVLLSALVSALVASHISRPIQRLRVGAQRIAKGNLKERVTPDFDNRKDEIGDLARDFDVMSEQISELLDTQRRMLRDVSHELRSPLARMQVALGLAEKRGAEDIKPELARIETEAETLNTMIGKILSLVRLQNISINQSELKWEQGDLVSILKALVESANYEAQQKNVDVEYEGLETAPFNMVSELMSSALENIIRNAVEYTKPDTAITVSVKKETGKYLICIEDKGSGVPENDLNKLFEPFYRVSLAREHNKGTGGIGLAIAKRAVELHGGSIWAENSVDGLLLNIRFSSIQQ